MALTQQRTINMTMNANGKAPSPAVATAKSAAIDDSPTSSTAVPKPLATAKSKRRLVGPYPRKNKQSSNPVPRSNSNASAGAAERAAIPRNSTSSSSTNAINTINAIKPGDGSNSNRTRTRSSSSDHRRAGSVSSLPDTKPISPTLASDSPSARRRLLPPSLGQKAPAPFNGGSSHRSTHRASIATVPQSPSARDRARQLENRISINAAGSPSKPRFKLRRSATDGVPTASPRTSSHHRRASTSSVTPDIPSSPFESYMASPPQRTGRIRSIAIEGFHSEHVEIKASTKNAKTSQPPAMPLSRKRTVRTSIAVSSPTKHASAMADDDHVTAETDATSISNRSMGTARSTSVASPASRAQGRRKTLASNSPVSKDKTRQPNKAASNKSKTPRTTSPPPPPPATPILSPAAVSRAMAKPSLIKAKLRDERRKQEKIRKREAEATARMQKLKEEISHTDEREKQHLEMELKQLKQVSELAALAKMADDMDSDVYSTDDDDTLLGFNLKGSSSGGGDATVMRGKRDAARPIAKMTDRATRQNSRKVISQMNSSFAMLSFSDDEDDDVQDDDLHEGADAMDYAALAPRLSPRIRPKRDAKSSPDVDSILTFSNHGSGDAGDADDETDTKTKSIAKSNATANSNPPARANARPRRGNRKKTKPKRNMSNLVPEMRRRISRKDINFDDDDAMDKISADDVDDIIIDGDSEHGGADAKDADSKPKTSQSTHGDMGRSVSADSSGEEAFAATSKSARASRVSTSSIIAEEGPATAAAAGGGAASVASPTATGKTNGAAATGAAMSGRRGLKMFKSKKKATEKDDNQKMIELRQKLEQAKIDFQRGHDLCWKFQDSAGALMEFRKALIVRESGLGKFHEDTGRTYYWIGRSLVKLKEFEEALVAFSRALRIFLRVLKTSHKYVKWTRSAIDSVFLEMDEDKEILQEYKRAVEDSIEYERVGDSLRKKGKLTEAIVQYRDAIDNIEEYHPDAADLYCKIAIIYRRQGEFERALDEYRFASEIYEMSLGADHPETVKALGNLVEKRRMGQLSMALMQQLNNTDIQ